MLYTCFISIFHNTQSNIDTYLFLPIGATVKMFTANVRERITAKIMKQYFDFTPYTTDIPMSFTINNKNYAQFIIEQITQQNIPLTYQCDTTCIDEGGPVEGTSFIAPPMYRINNTTITAPLERTMVNRLLSEDLSNEVHDKPIRDAYDDWYTTEILKEVQP